MVEPVQAISLESGQALAGKSLSFNAPPKSARTHPALPSAVDESMIQCLVLSVVDTAILVELSKMGRHALYLQAF